MKKKTYTVPAVKVVRLSHQYHLMANSVHTTLEVERQGYGEANSDNTIPEGEKTNGVWKWQ